MTKSHTADDAVDDPGLTPVAPNPEKVRFVTDPIEVHGFAAPARPAPARISRKMLEQIAEMTARAVRAAVDDATRQLRERVEEVELILEASEIPGVRRQLERIRATHLDAAGRMVAFEKEVVSASDE